MVLRKQVFLFSVQLVFCRTDTMAERVETNLFSGSSFGETHSSTPTVLEIPEATVQSQLSDPRRQRQHFKVQPVTKAAASHRVLRKQAIKSQQTHLFFAPSLQAVNQSRSLISQPQQRGFYLRPIRTIMQTLALWKQN